MARPIKNTPELYGRDARRFLNASRQKVDPKAKEAERTRIKNNVELLIAFTSKK